MCYRVCISPVYVIPHAITTDIGLEQSKSRKEDLTGENHMIGFISTRGLPTSRYSESCIRTATCNPLHLSLSAFRASRGRAHDGVRNALPMPTRKESSPAPTWAFLQGRLAFSALVLAWIQFRLSDLTVNRHDFCRSSRYFWGRRRRR